MSIAKDKIRNVEYFLRLDETPRSNQHVTDALFMSLIIYVFSAGGSLCSKMNRQESDSLITKSILRIVAKLGWGYFYSPREEQLLQSQCSTWSNIAIILMPLFVISTIR